MNTRQATALLQPYLSLLAPEVRKEMTVVTPESLGTPTLLHISKDTTLTRFVPGVSRRGLRAEDRSVARISTSPCLIGCILGYASDIFDFHQRQADGKFKNGNAVPFKGGYAIYGFKFDAALRPSRRLVPDVEKTDEHWLVPYDPVHAEYRPQLLGKVFYSSVNYDMYQEQLRNRIEMYVEVLTETPIWLDGRQQLSQGCWRVFVTNLHQSPRWNQVDLQFEKIQSTDYISVKRNVASMLSLEQYAPPSARW